MRGEAYGLPSYVSSFDVFKRTPETTQRSCIGGSLFNMTTEVLPSQTEAVKPKLSLLTDVGRKYPGFPTPLSPTLSAMRMFPSPMSDTCSEHAVHYSTCPTNRKVSQIGTDGSGLQNFNSRKGEYYASQSDIVINRSPMNSPRSVSFGQLPDGPYTCNPSTPPSSATATPSPRSPSLASNSPRAAMLKNMATKAALQNLSHNPTLDQLPRLLFYPSAMNTFAASTRSSAHSISPSHTSRLFAPARPSIHIANGTETTAASPIDPTGTMLFYTSNRNVDSGLLGVRPLSEAQVAEYRFWRPCGRRLCAFGCGGAHEGEWAAAKRLFKAIEEVKAEEEVGDAKASFEFGSDGLNELVAGSVADCDDGAESGFCGGQEEVRFPASSVWAGRRLVTNWNQFLSGCEREGVARF